MTPNVKGKAVTSDVKGKTKATGAKGEKATSLKQFLSNLATDARKLGEFLHEPEAAMSDANLSEEDKTALRSGVAGMVAARLAGVPMDQAFKLMVYPVLVFYPYPMKFESPLFAAYPQKVAAQAPPMFGMYPQKVVAESAYPPPQYMVHPPQFVVQPPPHYVMYPPQFVVQPPPQFVVYQPYYPR